MENEQIEKIVKDADNNYEIKTSASSIMQAYEEKQRTKQIKTKKSKIIWITSGSLVTCATAIVLAIVIPSQITSLPSTTGGVIIVPSSTNPIIVNPQEGIYGGTRSQTAFQVYSGVSLLSNIESESSISLLKKRQNATENQFKTIVDAFDSAYTNIERFITGTEYHIDNVIEKGVFESTTIGVPYYSYRMTINDSIVFLTNESFEEEDDDEVETIQLGEIIADDNLGNYYVEIKEEKKLNEIEVDIKIERKGYELEISHEDEKGEREYEYELKLNGNLHYSETISWESGDDDGINIEIENINNSFEFTHIELKDSFLTTDYTYNDISGSMTVTSSTTGRIYKDTGNLYQIEKPIKA